MASICGSPVCAGGKPKLKFTYTGDYVVRDDGVVELLTSGTIVFLEPRVIDVFCVGGGGAGYRYLGGSGAFGGGGGGYCRTRKALSVFGEYSIVIGAGGVVPTVGYNTSKKTGGDTVFGDLVTAEGGYTQGSTSASSSGFGGGGKGGSGGGGGVWANRDFGAGGSNGSDGENGFPADMHTGGTGAGISTHEFGENEGKLYAGGGGGGRYLVSNTPVQSLGGSGGGGAGGWAYGTPQPAGAGGANTGGGGGGGVAVNASSQDSAPAGNGGSGIVCFRDAYELPELAGTWVLNDRLYAPENDFDETTSYRFKVGTIECTRIRTSNLTYLSAYRVFSGDTVDIYTFSTNAWKTTARNLTFPAGATASDEFRAWLASNATKQA